jgi:hypothetical protein
MIGRFPIVTFDTTAHNRLVEDGPLSEAVLAGLKSGMFFRFAGLSIEEIASCPDPVKRAALFNYCGRLQACRRKRPGLTTAVRQRGRHPSLRASMLSRNAILAAATNVCGLSWNARP